jgi:hypothetical protein
MNIEVTYIVKWQIKDNPNYVWTSCKKLINCKTGKEVKRTIKGLQAGYWIDRKFVKLSELKSKIELINQEKLPF